MTPMSSCYPERLFLKALYFHLFCKVCECVDEDITRHENNRSPGTDEDVSNTSKGIVVNWKASRESHFFIRNKKLKKSI